MNSNLGGKAADQDSDYDGAWKQALRDYFRLFLSKYFPAMFSAIDWSVSVEWLDKEVSQVLGQSGQRNRVVDLLVKVRLMTGDDQWILLHVEVQTSYEKNFAPRLSRYNAGVYWTFDRRVATLVILADLREDWLPNEDSFEVGDFVTRMQFPVCKLVKRLESDWKDDTSLPVQLARAQIAALRTAGDPTGRYEFKWQLVRNLYEAGYDADQLREIFRLIDWMMHLRPDLETEFERELTAFEEERNMPYLTSVERVAEARGAARGVLKVLSALCGTLPVDAENQILALPMESVDELAEEIVRLRTADDVMRWLDARAATNE